jgi:hypothetical protein
MEANSVKGEVFQIGHTLAAGTHELQFKAVFSVQGEPLKVSSNAIMLTVEPPEHNKHKFPGGSGTAQDPYHVATPEDLNAVRFNLSAHYIQINDIDMTFDTQDENGLYYNNGAGWKPIGTSQTNAPRNEWEFFSGVYDGGGYEIIGLKIHFESPYERIFAGLFGGLDFGAEVRNLGMEGGDIYVYANSIDVYSYLYVGSIAGFIRNSIIANCYNTGDIYADSYHFINVGGIVGWSNLIGESSDSIISGCYNTGNITASLNAPISAAGGIAGYASATTVTDCRNEGEISAYTDAGGIIGFPHTCIISNSLNTGNISGHVFVGGISGEVIRTEIIDCSNEGSVVAETFIFNQFTFAGGIIGRNETTLVVNESSVIKNSNNTGNVSSLGEGVRVFTGGIAGSASNITIINSNNTGHLSSSGIVGAIIGSDNGGNTIN